MREISAVLQSRDHRDPLVLLALATVIAGLLFKISAVPFHMWAPDAYDGAPLTATAYLAVASKAASFAILLRILLGPFAALRDVWLPVIAVAALATLTVGNLAAVGQDNFKRLMAYSSIAHAGYILLGLIAGNNTGLSAIAMYLVTYSAMTLGLIFCAIALRGQEENSETLAGFSGLIRRSPWIAVCALIFLLSLAGLPPTGGFWGKYYIFLALLETGHTALAIVAVLYVAVAAYYYFRLVRYIFAAPASPSDAIHAGWGMRIALAVSAIFTLGAGIFPEPLLRIAQRSVLP